MMPKPPPKCTKEHATVDLLTKTLAGAEYLLDKAIAEWNKATEYYTRCISGADQFEKPPCTGYATSVAYALKQVNARKKDVRKSRDKLAKAQEKLDACMSRVKPPPKPKPPKVKSMAKPKAKGSPINSSGAAKSVASVMPPVMKMAVPPSPPGPLGLGAVHGDRGSYG